MTLSSTPTFTVVQPTVTLADPHILSDIRDRRSIIDAVYDSLVRRSSNGTFLPWLASHWSQQNQGRRWVFTLRDDVRFHNGRVLAAQDAADSLLRALSPDMPGELGTEGVLLSYFTDVQITAVNNRELHIETVQPFADLLDLLVDIPVLETSSLPELVGSGPYRATEYQTGKIVMKAFTEHWAGTPPVQTLVWLAEPDSQKRLALLQEGKADLAVDIPPNAAITKPANLNVVKQKSYLCVIFLLNLFEGAMQDRRVRQALNHALDLRAIIDDPKIAAGQAEALAGPLSPRHYATPKALPAYEFNPQKARELLAEAGYPNGLTLELALPAKFPDESIPLAQRIAQQLLEVGVSTKLEVYEDRPGYSQRVRNKQYGDICCFDSSPASTWRVYVEKLDSRRQGPWWQGYHSDALNTLLDKSSATYDHQQRAALLEDAFALVQQDAPWLFLYAPDFHWALGSKADGWQPSAEGRVRIIHTANGE